MKFVLQFLIIMVFAFVGELLHYFIPLPIPASIYGIVLLFLALELKVVKVSDIEQTSSFLIAIMPLMFLPPAVGVIESWDLIQGAWLPYVVVTVVSTVLRQVAHVVWVGSMPWQVAMVVGYRERRRLLLPFLMFSDI